ncbi:MAG: PqiC family protein [Desulfobacterales bacterium]|nr:PqiC family protein [Desulfobacterales bacterium]
MYEAYSQIRRWMIAAALFAVIGCATTPPPNFYQLEETASTQLSGLERGIAVGVGPVNVAPYLDRPQVVIRGMGHKLELSEFNRWVEPLTDSIPRVIIVSLSNLLETTRVYRVPRRNETIPLEFRTEIDIARFDGTLGGDALLVARWTLYGRQETALLTKVSIIREPAGGNDFDNLIAAQNRALQRFSREIADAINANR